MPAGLRDAYRKSLADSTLADLREPLAVLDAIVKRSMDRVEERDTPELRKRALELIEEVQGALSAGDAELGAQKLQALHALLRRGADESEALSNLSDAVDVFARRAEAYWNVKLSRRQSMNAADLIDLMRAFVSIVKTEAPADVSARIVERIDHDVYRGGFGLRLLGGEAAEPGRTIEAEAEPKTKGARPRKKGAEGA
jgi:DNA-binding GntR family transcriptional regulator